MLRASLLALAAQALVLSVPVLAQEPAPVQHAAPPAATAAEDPALTGATARSGSSRAARPTPPAASRQMRRPRSYRQCHRVARERRLRGAQRRAFTNRCRLGYSRVGQP